MFGSACRAVPYGVHRWLEQLRRNGLERREAATVNRARTVLLQGGEMPRGAVALMQGKAVRRKPTIVFEHQSVARGHLDTCLPCAETGFVDPLALAARLHAIPGVVEHGLFVGMAEMALIGKNGEVIRLRH